MLMAQQSPWNQ